ncbi:TetR/AcrR family transcriptional regulator [Agrococcus sp. ProA11]|uniref:TetR/AcrR family transcriptional regulator n=1 Tax=Agrococcus chionoecetis TaxID=3153752 RepID=UPI00326181E0
MAETQARARASLDRNSIIVGAVELADEIGLEPLTIRRLAEHLGARPMTLYHYVSGKDDIVTGMVGRVFDEVERPLPGAPWKEAIRARALSLRAALRRHPWAIPIMESRRTPGPDILDHHEALLTTWLSTGFPLPQIAHGLAIVDAFVYGFVLQEAALPFGDRDGDLSEASDGIVAPLSAERYPALVRFTTEHVMQPGYSFGDSFEVGLDLVLDGIERRGTSAAVG